MWGNKMNFDLDLPSIKGEPLPPLLRSMDEINTWIEHDYRLFFNRELYEKEKRLCSVNKPFVLDAASDKRQSR
jgi:hypothetical protein